MKKINIHFKDIILFENDNYIVVDKPPFVSSLKDRNDEDDISSLAKAYFPESIVNHRLDKETSGALVIAKNLEAYKNFSIQLEHREVDKRYIALVWGVHNFVEMLIEAPIFITGSGKVRIDRLGKYSATIVKTIEKFRNNTLVECKILTGKKHQIRVHLASGDAPLVHDYTYGGKPLLLSDIKRGYKSKEHKDQEEAPLSKRVCLHSQSVKFKDIDGTEISVTSPLPKDFELILKQLRKHASLK